MATPAEIQAQLDSAATGRVANIQTVYYPGTVKTNLYVVGMVGYAGRSRWCETTTADSAAAQATSILSQLAG